MLDDNPHQISALPHLYKDERFSKKNFAENKLWSRLKNLSLQFKIYPSFLQQTLVRPSKLHLVKFPPNFE